jgi:hypothetical protein
MYFFIVWADKVTGKPPNKREKNFSAKQKHEGAQSFAAFGKRGDFPQK